MNLIAREFSLIFSLIFPCLNLIPLLLLMPLLARLITPCQLLGTISEVPINVHCFGCDAVGRSARPGWICGIAAMRVWLTSSSQTLLW